MATTMQPADSEQAAVGADVLQTSSRRGAARISAVSVSG
jgi:hypothetical protein